MKRLALAAVALGALAAPALARATPPPIARPDPVTYPVTLDYTSPLPTLHAIGQGVVAASKTDLGYLAYENVDDLGGFVPAPVGHSALWRAVPGKVSIFAFSGAATGPSQPDNGNGHGVEPPIPPTPGNVVPPANQGFGGQGGAGGGGGTTTTATRRHHRGGGGTTTTTKRRQPPATTTTTTAPAATTAAITTTAVTTTTTTTATSGGGGGGGGCNGGSCSPGSCGTPGISITSTAPSCTITLTNASPGSSAQETMTVQNTSGSPYTLSFEATGTSSNHLWQDLQMAVYDTSGGTPTPPYPALTSWLGSFQTLTTLNPGQTVQYVIVLYLPTTAGNADQGMSAVIGFDWRAG